MTLTDPVSRSSVPPVYDGDIFSPEALRRPFAHYRAIRDLGAVVRLPRPDVYVISRFKDVQQALRSPDILISGLGVGLNDPVNEPLPEQPVLMSDGARHRRLRSVIARPLMPAALREQKDMLRSLMQERIDTLRDGQEIEAVSALARHLPLGAVSHLVGLPEEGRVQMLRWAAATFDAMGPLETAQGPNRQVQEQLAVFGEAMTYFQDVDPSRLRPGSWAQGLFDAVGEARLSEGEARAALAGLVLPALDTTIYAKANLLHNLGSHPEQWQMLRECPELIPSAVLEGVRHGAVVRWFTRIAAEDYETDDVFVPRGGRVMLLYGSANRDERHYADPGRFDVTRNPADQLGWGSGPHLCAGMNLARLEMEVLLEIMVGNISRIEVGEPQFGTNLGLYGIDRLPMRLHR